MSGIQRYIRWNGKPAINFYKDREFAEFRVCLDSEKAHLVNEANAQALVDTMIVLNSIYFALRSGSEHQKLSSDHIQVNEKTGYAFRTSNIRITFLRTDKVVLNDER